MEIINICRNSLKIMSLLGRKNNELEEKWHFLYFSFAFIKMAEIITCRP